MSELNLATIGTERQIEALRKASFPTLSNDNFIVAMKIAKQYDLDPFAKEIWWWEQQGKTMIVVSNAGYMRIARQQEWFISITAQAVFPWDDFSIDFSKNEISHKLDISKRIKGDMPIGAYAILDYLSNGKEQRNIKFVPWEEYAKTSSVWQTNKSAMISKVATTVVCREVYGLSWLYTEEEIVGTDEGKQNKLLEQAKRPTETTASDLLLGVTKEIKEVPQETPAEIIDPNIQDVWTTQ